MEDSLLKLKELSNSSFFCKPAAERWCKKVVQNKKQTSTKMLKSVGGADKGT